MSNIISLASLRGDRLIHTADLSELGMSAREIARACHDKHLIKLRRGVYVQPPQSGDLDADELYRLLVRATNSVKGDSVVSHESAASLHRLPLIGRWPSVVHTTLEAASGGSSSPGLRRHTTARLPEPVVVDGVRVTSVARTLVDIGASNPLITSVAMLDHALRENMTVLDELWDELGRLGRRPGAKRCATALAFADGRSGSPGESGSRTRMHELGFQAPELQIPVVADGQHFEVDFGWEAAGLFGEFDGAVKYTRGDMLRGRSVSEVVVNEKNRENKIHRMTKRTFARWTWSEMIDPRAFYRVLSEAGVPHTRRSKRQLPE